MPGCVLILIVLLQGLRVINSWKCPYCHNVKTTKKNLLSHVRLHHEGSLDAEQKLVKCPFRNAAIRAENLNKRGIRRIDIGKVTRHTRTVKNIIKKYFKNEPVDQLSSTILNSSMEHLCHLVAAECGAVLERGSKLYANENDDAKTVSSVLNKSDYFIPNE